MSKGKEIKKTEEPSRDSTFRDAEFAFNNKLGLPQELKDYLTSQGLDWRFLNAREYVANGNIHSGHWRAFKVPADKVNAEGFYGANAEGLVQRGDLILGVRTKAISAAHKEHINKRNQALYRQGSVEGQAKKLREVVKDSSLSAETRITEGYED
jgi:hypothetical protein